MVSSGAALFGLAFRMAFDEVFRTVYRAPDLLVAFSSLPPLVRLTLPAAGGCVAGALALFAQRFGGAQGVGGVMETLAIARRRISVRGTALRALGSWMAIVTGGSVGREGPIIQFGGGLGGAVGAWLGLRDSRRSALIAAGTAAGFAAVYNTPFAAMFFVFEIVVGAMTIDMVPRVAIATAIATAISRSVMGSGPLYGVRSFRLVSWLELGGHALLGVSAGVAGVAFVVLLARSEGAFARLPVPRYFRTALGGLIVGALAIALPEITGNGFEAIRLLLDGKLSLVLVALLFFAKAAATSSSVGSGTPGGVFTPSLFLGAALGATFGHLAGLVAGPGNVGAPGSYAIVGMAAVVAATTHAPIMAAVLAFELSGDYDIVLPLLVSTAMSTIVAQRLKKESIYTAELRRSGLSLDASTRRLTLRWTERREADPGSDI